MYNIGEKVRVKTWEELDDSKKGKVAGNDPRLFTPAKARNCGKSGTICDRLYSDAYGCYVYSIVFDGQSIPSNASYTEDALDPAETKSWRMDITEQDGVVIATLYERSGESERRMAFGHGHIFHDGIYGYVQAASYAVRRIYKQFEETNKERKEL